jgi:hypothetical protein
VSYPASAAYVDHLASEIATIYHIRNCPVEIAPRVQFVCAHRKCSRLASHHRHFPAGRARPPPPLNTVTVFSVTTTIASSSLHRHPGALRQIHPGACRPEQSVHCSPAARLLPGTSCCSSGVLYHSPTCTSCAFILLQSDVYPRPFAYIFLAPGGRQSVLC